MSSDFGGSSSVCVLEDIFNALERIGLGLEKKDAVMSEQKRKLVAYHEAGALDHWLVHTSSLNLIQYGASLVHPDRKSYAKTEARRSHPDNADIVHSCSGENNENHAYQESTFAFAGQVMQSWVR